MSNRARRSLLRLWRQHAVIADLAATDRDIPEHFRTMKEMNRWWRFEFMAIWREPLRFPGSILADSGLIRIQARNRPEYFNLLKYSFPVERPDLPLWSDLREDFEAAERVFNDAQDWLEPHKKLCRRRFDWDRWADRAFIDGFGGRTGKPDPVMFILEAHQEDAEYVARLQKAARAFNQSVGFCLHQHTSRYGPIYAARLCLRKLDDRLTDLQILSLMAMYAAHRAGETMLELAQRIQQEGNAADVDRYDQAREYLRVWIEPWARQEHRYFTQQLAEARELLALANKEAAKEALAAIAPDAERGKEQRARLADMREGAKLANTRYSDALKEEWREYDLRNLAEATRTLNNSDRVRAVLHEFKLPNTAGRTVLRALS